MTDPISLEPILSSRERGRLLFNEDLPHDGRYAAFEEHILAGGKIEAGDWMPDEYRQVLMLRYLAGADYETIARQLALTNGSLRGLLHRGLAMLRSQMEQSNPNEKSS